MARALSPPTRILGRGFYPACGALCAGIEKISAGSHFMIGKPSPWIIRAALNNTGALGRDRYRRRQPAHRHSGGVRAGLETILVLSGVSTINV